MNVTDFLNDPLGIAVQGAVVAAFLDFLFGVYAAFRDGTFAIDSLASFVRKHLLGRVFPSTTLAVAAFVTDNQLMAAAAIGSLAAYAAETLGSIYFSIKPPSPSETKEIRAEELSNPIPQD